MITISSEITSNLNVGEKRKDVIERSFSSSAIQTVNVDVEEEEVRRSRGRLPPPITGRCAALKAVREARRFEPSADSRRVFFGSAAVEGTDPYHRVWRRTEGDVSDDLIDEQ